MWTRGDTCLGGQVQPRSAGLWVLEDRALCTGTGSEEVSLKGDTGAALSIDDRANTRCGAWGYIWEVGC